MFAINPTDPAPIWRQIEEGVRRLIALGALRAGAPVPSVRDLAKDLRVNPNTVARAYQRLTEGGVLSVKRGEGTYVADEPPITRKAERNEALRDAATRYASTSIAVGASLDDAVDELNAAHERVVREHRRKA
ncbi:MAG TPA: GntR family transcriptional regulator [Thermoanaerobaculia bacterium]|jgi:GntR family transcriptional regulator|nr:GntR family transcriptional regulator [Thermoanaerobaculia bacterium]